MNGPTALNIILSLLSSCNRRRYLHAKKCKSLATRDKYFTARTFPRFSFSSRAPICAGWSTITHLFLFALRISGIQNNLAYHLEQQLGPVGCRGDGSYWWPCVNSNLLSCKPGILPFVSFAFLQFSLAPAMCQRPQSFQRFNSSFLLCCAPFCHEIVLHIFVYSYIQL